MALINGKNLFVEVRTEDGTYYPIACDRSCTLTLSRGMLKVCDPSSIFAKYIPGGNIEATLEGDGLVNFNKHISAATLQQMLIAGTLVRMLIDIADVTYNFDGYVNNLALTGARRAAASFTYAFTITGEVGITDNAPKDPDEVGVQNLLLVEPEGDLFDINEAGDHMII